MDLVETPASPGDPAGFPEFVFDDANGNGVDDGRETQGQPLSGFAQRDGVGIPAS